jgi:hypothetical protein
VGRASAVEAWPYEVTDTNLKLAVCSNLLPARKGRGVNGHAVGRPVIRTLEDQPLVTGPILVGWRSTIDNGRYPISDKRPILSLKPGYHPSKRVVR